MSGELVGELDTTVTGGTTVASGEAATRVKVLAIVHHPDASRIGETVGLGARSMALDRVSDTFPGGPLAEPGVSRVHAVIEPAEGGGVLARDLGSKNGTYVRGREVPRDGVRVGPGDVVRLGEVLIMVVEGDSPPPGDADVPAIVGFGQAARRLRSAIARCATRSAPVLVEGETGTGKDLAARAIAAMGRPGQSYLAMNAAAVPASLVDSILFGHVRGAFTDAREESPGLFRSCDGGTLLLDEVGDLPAGVQAKLLRVVEEGQVLPLGASRAARVDVRLVAATNRDLVADAGAGRFRPDLLARLSQLVVRCPPLRDRMEDLPLIALRLASGRPFVAAALERMMLHAWPMNVRELRAAVEQALADATGTGPLLLPRAVVARLDATSESLAPRRRRGGAVDRAGLEAALARSAGNVSRAAASLGIDRANLYRLARRLGVDLASHR